MTTEFKPIGSMILMNTSGDVTITWAAEHESEMRSLIEQKLKQGYTFFIVKKKCFGLVKHKEKLIDVNQLKVGADLLLRDEDAIKLFTDGKVKATKNKQRDYETEGSSKDVDLILKKDTLAVKPIAAG